jgi:hypothetical protein
VGIVRRGVADGLPFKSSFATQATAALGLEFRESCGVEQVGRAVMERSMTSP